MTSPPSPHAEVVVDLGAIRHNVRRLRELVTEDGSTPPQLMVVVKADAYGHGMLPVARAARAAGAEWLGVSTGDEALALRRAGDTGRLLCWLAAPGADYRDLIALDVDVTTYSVRQLEEIVDSARGAGRVARLQIKFDTGLSRGGAPRSEWQQLVAAARTAEQDGSIRVTGLWSHLACSDEPQHPANAAQLAAFNEALALADQAGLDPEVRHLANSAGAILHPGARHELVRLGIAVYGLSPAPDVRSSEDLGLVAAMTVRGSVVLTKELAASEGVSYGHTYTTRSATQLAVVPIGYGDGVPRQASNAAQVQLGGHRYRIAGRVCMDQFVLDVGEAHAAAGDRVVLFGPGDDGEPTAQDWADAVGTINYEIVTRLGARVPREHVG